MVTKFDMEAQGYELSFSTYVRQAPDLVSIGSSLYRSIWTRSRPVCYKRARSCITCGVVIRTILFGESFTENVGGNVVITGIAIERMQKTMQ